MGRAKPDPVEVAVGQRIRIARTARRMTLAALAARIGITGQQLQYYEQGRSRVTIARLSHIARVLAVPLSTFFDEPEMKKCESIFALLDAPGSLRLLRAYAQVRKPARQPLIKLVENIARNQPRR